MKAHAHTQMGAYGPATWRDGAPPDIAAGRTTGRLRHCSWCGSMHPAELAAALKAGAKLDPADRKYGWPHKFYVNGVPNPHAGMLESRMSSSHAVPNCPRTGQACEHGRQGFHAPVCECMSERPCQVTTGTVDGKQMVVIPDGFSRATGQRDYRWTEAGKPAEATTWGKFYTEHLQDADPDDRQVIERAMGMTFNFTDDGKVSWALFSED